MAENRFNLADEPWIPVADVGEVSLRRLFEDESLRALGGTPLWKIAIMKLLQAVAQAARTPENFRDWQALGPRGLALACLEYLERRHDDFWLYGARPFLQMPAVAGAKVLPYGALMPEVATGNTTPLFQSQWQPPMTDALKARLLLVNMACCFSGKKVDNSIVLSAGVEKSVSAPAGPALCSLGLLHSFLAGNTIRETVWFNLLAHEDIRREKTFTAGLGTPPWERMPALEACPVAEGLRASLMGRLVPMARFLLLDGDGLHCVEGIRHPDYLKGGMWDPSAAVDARGKKNRALWTDPSRRPWRALPSLLSFIRSGKMNADLVCLLLTCGVPRLREARVGAFRLWCGGIRLSSNAGEQYLTGADDVVESELGLHTEDVDCERSMWFDNLRQNMELLENMGQAVYSAVRSYYREEKADTADKHARRASEIFWQLAERRSGELFTACGGDDADAVAPAVAAVMRRMAACGHEAYNAVCPQGTARQLQNWAKNRPGFRTGLKQA